MEFKDAIKSGFAKYVTFNGRSVRSEYWYWVLFVILVSLVCTILDSVLFSAAAPVMDASGTMIAGAAPTKLFSTLWSLGTFLPGIAVAVRRLHDINRSGWWLLICLIPLVGAIIFIFWACTKGDALPNRFGLPHTLPLVG